MCDVDGDCDLQQSTTITARKPHVCYACRETIEPRERYVRTTQIAEGTASSYHHCLRCWAMLEVLWTKTESAVEWDLNCGEVWRDPPPEVARLAFLTRAEIQALRVTP